MYMSQWHFLEKWNEILGIKPLLYMLLYATIKTYDDGA